MSLWNNTAIPLKFHFLSRITTQILNKELQPDAKRSCWLPVTTLKLIVCVKSHVLNCFIPVILQRYESIRKTRTLLFSLALYKADRAHEKALTDATARCNLTYSTNVVNIHSFTPSLTHLISVESFEL